MKTPLLALLPVLVLGCGDDTQPAADLSSRRDLTEVVEGDMAQPEETDMAVAPAGKAVGEACQQDDECKSKLCKPAVPGGSTLCVIGCKAQAECAAYADTYCAPTAAGAADGWCVPRSSTLCAPCAKDADCGVVGERCWVPMGKKAGACASDCFLGDDACPADYACSAVSDGGKARKLCLPKMGECADNLGGDCGRTSAPQACARVSDAGTCTGQRTCEAASKRYGKCDAMVPALRKTCKDADPTGCMLNVDPAALNTPESCGMCGKSCPGVGSMTSDPTCAMAVCGLTCRGDNYDVDGDAANGCEIRDAVPPGHDMAGAQRLKEMDCHDSTTATFMGSVPSDARAHTNPAVTGFSATVGAAPDYFVVKGTGGFTCQNSYDVTFTVTDGNPMCDYKCTFKTDKKTETLIVKGTGAKNVGGGYGSYSSDSDIYFIVEKTCAASVTPQKNVTYSVKFNL